MPEVKQFLQLDTKDEGGDESIRVNLIPVDDESMYAGILYLGQGQDKQQKQPVKVVFDTGSEYLTVTSNYCSSQSPGVDDGKVTKSRCATQAYDTKKSKSGKKAQDDFIEVTYGGSKLEGIPWNDHICLNPQKCLNFNFLALNDAQGLEASIDGILGISPNKEGDFSDFHIMKILKD